MIIDLKEIAKLEKKYQNDRIALDALHNMVQIVSAAGHEELTHPSLAILTLLDLGVLKVETSKKEIQQLNS